MNIDLCKFLFEFFDVNYEFYNISNAEKYRKFYFKNGSNTTQEANVMFYYVDLCHKIESNLGYLYWLFSLFSPLLKLILVLFLLPFIIVLFIYASSLFLYLKRHWLSLKVCFRFIRLFEL